MTRLNAGTIPAGFLPLVLLLASNPLHSLLDARELDLEVQLGRPGSSACPSLHDHILCELVRSLDGSLPQERAAGAALQAFEHGRIREVVRFLWARAALSEPGAPRGPPIRA